MGTKRTILLVTALVAVVALVPILLVATSGSGQPKPKAAVASALTTTSTPTATTSVRAAKRHANAAVHHRQARRAAAVKHPRHPHHKTPSKPGTTTPQTTRTAATTTSTPQATSAPTSITFDLLGRSGDATSNVCGAPRHYHTYSTGQTLGISGRVKPIPSATWKVKVKIEVCSGALFTEFVKIEPTLNKHRGTFSGSFPAPAAGFYRARAELYVNDVRTVDSPDDHFQTL